ASETALAARKSQRSRVSGRTAQGSRLAPRRCARARTRCSEQIRLGAQAHKRRLAGGAWAGLAQSRSVGAERRRSSQAVRLLRRGSSLSFAPRDACVILPTPRRIEQIFQSVSRMKYLYWRAAPGRGAKIGANNAHNWR